MLPRRTYDLTREPTGEIYYQLLSLALESCSTLSLVIRNTKSLDTCQEFLEKLDPFLIESVKTSEWPGTILYKHEASLYRYKLNPSLVRVMIQRSEGLYDWIEPALPEDPCFYRTDGSVWLATIAHERDGYLELTSEEFNRLSSGIPSVPEYLKPHESAS